MNFANLKTMDLDDIQTLSVLFAHRGLKNPVAAAAYYVLLLKKFPTTFSEMSKDARELLRGIYRASAMRNARLELLREGFIAQVLPLTSYNLDFGREMYLPMAPEFVWQDNIHFLEEKMDLKEISHRFERIEELQSTYKNVFGKYGIKIQNGSVTLFHSSRWLLSYLNYNMSDNKNIRMLMGTLKSFEGPYIKYYEKMLEAGLKTKIICDPAVDKKTDQRILNILKLKENYPKSIEIRATPLSYDTSRRMIYDNMAIDGRKLRDIESDLAYISTIYLQERVIASMKNHFDSAFANSLDLGINREKSL